PLRRRLHDQPAARGLPLGARSLRRYLERPAPPPRPRRAAAPDRPPSLRLEERQVGERRRAPGRGPPRLLGGERLPRLRRSLERAALPLPGDPRGLPGPPAGERARPGPGRGAAGEPVGAAGPPAGRVGSTMEPPGWPMARLEIQNRSLERPIESLDRSIE